MSNTSWRPTLPSVLTGIVTDFFDTLGIGSFAVTTAISRRWKLTDDLTLPGTMNVGHALPTIAQAVIFIGAIAVEQVTLVAMIAAAVIGSWIGAKIVSGFSRQKVQFTMGVALLVAATLLLLSLLGVVPAGGEAMGLSGGKLAVAIVGNFILGALMPAGIGLYGPCMILVYMLGMHPAAAFPIMMGSCAVLMPIASWKFIVEKRVDRSFAAGLALGGVPAVLVAALIVKSLPLLYVKWLVLVVVVYTAVGLVRASRRTGA